MAHPAVFEACVVGVPHEKWGERPLACVVLRDRAQPVAKDELLQFLNERAVKWWVPNDVVFLAEIPKTSVGKFLKRSLREQFRRHYSGEAWFSFQAGSFGSRPGLIPTKTYSSDGFFGPMTYTVTPRFTPKRFA